MRHRQPLVAALTMVIAGACGSSTSVCTLVAYNAVGLTVVDSISGQAPSVPTTVLFSGATFRDSLSNTDGMYALGVGRSGDFTIVVKASGYSDWSQRARVSADACGKPKPVSITARLQRVAP